MKKIKSIGALSLGKVLGIIYAVIGLVVGIIFFITSFFAPEDVMEGIMFFGFGSLVFFPLLYGVLGFVSGILSALLYNFISKKIGGIEVEIEKS